MFNLIKLSKLMFLLFIFSAFKVGAAEVEPHLLKVYSITQFLELVEGDFKRDKTDPRLLRLTRSSRLICIDLDEVSVHNGSNEPLEGETSKVYRHLIDEGYSVMMVTARNNGKKARNNDLSELCQQVEELHDNLGDNSICFPGVDDTAVPLNIDGQEQHGYFIGGVFYAGTHKGPMVHAILPFLENARAETLKEVEKALALNDVAENDERMIEIRKRIKMPYEKLFMLDDQEVYLATFSNWQPLMDHFNRDVFLVHFPYVWKNAYSIGTLETVLEIVEKNREKITPGQVLVVLGLDNVSVNKDTNEALEDEITTAVYRDLIDSGYIVLMMTTRQKGKKADKNEIESMSSRVSELHENLRDNSDCFPPDNQQIEKKLVDRNGMIEYGYFLRGVFFAGPNNYLMLSQIINELHGRIGFRKLVIVDDNELGPNDCAPLMKKFRPENVSLVHFSDGMSIEK